MTKTFLLSATALAAVIAAGSASAQEVTAVRVANQIVYDSSATPASTPLPIARETVNSVAARTSATNNSVALEVEELFPGATYEFTYALTGAVFPTAVSAAVPTVSGAGAFSASCYTFGAAAISGGTAGSATVTYRLTLDGVAGAAGSGNCEAAAFAVIDEPITITFPFPLRAAALAASSIRATSAVGSNNTVIDAVDPGIAETITLAALVDGYEFVVDADTGSDTRLSLSTDPVYTGLTGGGYIGDAGFQRASLTDFATSNAVVGYSGTIIPAVVSDIELNISGGADFEELIPAGFTVDADDNTVATLDGVTGTASVNLSAAGGLEEAIANGTSTVTATVTADFAAPSTTVTLPEDAFTGTLELIELEGTTFVAPWMTTGAGGYNTVLRIANGNDEATGSVLASVRSSVVAPTVESYDFGPIPANGELVINSARLAEAFGAFTRGDVFITILSLEDGLTAKLRTVNPGGVVSEQTLGSASGIALTNITQ